MFTVSSKWIKICEWFDFLIKIELIIKLWLLEGRLLQMVRLVVRLIVRLWRRWMVSG